MLSYLQPGPVPLTFHVMLMMNARDTGNKRRYRWSYYNEQALSAATLISALCARRRRAPTDALPRTSFCVQIGC